MKWFILALFIVCATVAFPWPGQAQVLAAGAGSFHVHRAAELHVRVFQRAEPAVPGPKDFPELKVLLDRCDEIREEALRLFGDGHIKASDKYNDAGFNSFFKSGWKRFYLKWYDADHPSASALCPVTTELLKGIPNIKAAMFACVPRVAGCRATAIPMPVRCVTWA